MIVAGWVLVGVLVGLVLWAHSYRAATPPPPPPAITITGLPKTWLEFCRSPLPLRAEDVPMRGSDDEQLATVLNHSAAMRRINRGY